MYLKRKDITKIAEIMDENPDARSFKLVESKNSGIGCILTLEVDTQVKDRQAVVIYEISGVEDW